ncbi:hypothetical protein EDEG_03461 [Edhazardia aedis USNM 41457]|uniref:DWNN domain-containing protein n=1 Tax=Edhazardia aedis (strain USNM 41457) TaxID=1003232 RepID=J9D2S5_EDHAE|nr:hypothetical protein EDEG_03461 [Edhazardia aedis USNM 41457]|eukprot:EJW02101.1 hypothetical protein EDEG_03461 [Edhazardia aedis USNM 41457]
MAECIYYRFNSSKNFSKLVISAESLPLWELRAEIVTVNKMVSNDFDLLFYEEGNLIDDEYFIIHKNARITLKRVPIWMSKILRKGEEIKPFTEIVIDENNVATDLQNTKSEEDVLSNLEIKEKPTDITVKIRSTIAETTRSKNVPTNTSYICFRCGKKGHFIQNCPTNVDSSFDNVKLRKPKGIPKAFLQQVEKADELKGLLITQKGLVKVQPQVEQWDKLKKGFINVPDALKCRVCKSLFLDPVISECQHVFCNECVTEDLICCGKNVKIIGEDIHMRRKIEEFIEKSGG